MKVCLVGCLPVELGGKVNGGIASHIYELYKSLKVQDIDVSIFSNGIEKSTCNDAISYISKLDQLVCAVFGVLRFRRCKIEGYSIKESLKILSDANRIVNIKKTSETIFHVHSLSNSAALSCEIAKVRYVVTDHAYWQGNKGKERIKDNIKNAKSIVAISNYSFYKIKQLDLGVNIEKINNPISKIDTRKKVKKNNEFKVYFNGISDGWNRKGLSRISSELQEILSIENIQLIIVSDYDSISKLKSENKSLADNKSLIILEPMTREKNLELLNSCDIYLAPSLSEGFSIAYLESVYLNVPVIGFSPNTEEINDLLGEEYCLGFDHENDNLKEKINKIKNRKEIKIDTNILLWESNIHRFINLYQNALKA